MDKELGKAIEKAMALEQEGQHFYTECAKRTTSKEAQEMFRYLAREEEDHYNKIKDIYQRDFGQEYKEEKKTKEETGIFRKLGKNLDERSDALEAVNMGIEVEKESIKLYEELSQKASNEEMEKLFEKLVKEEEKHKAMLETDLEFLTETGAYYDFKVVTT